MPEKIIDGECILDNSLRLKLWTFIKEYKRVVGDDIFFFDLVENPDELDKYINIATTQGDATLRNVVGDLNKLIRRNNLTEGYRESAKSYRNLLESKLSKGALTFLDREELDNKASVGLLTTDEKTNIEKDVYLSRGKSGSIYWEAELRRSFRKLFDINGNIKEHEKLRLVDTYVAESRISLLIFESIFGEEKDKKVLFESSSVNKKNKLWRTSAAGIIILTILSVGVYSNYTENKANTDNVLAQPNVYRPATVVVSGAITFDTTWYAETSYVLSGPVFVEGNAILTIEPGTQIKGGFESGLIITKDAKINANGTKDAPIVFTSAKPEGERERGDWGGLVLLGNARINQGINSIEGISKNDVRGQFGGNNDSDSCGVLEYVRIEFAGLEVFKDNELNGLTMGGCGRETVVSHVQVHRAYDDGIEMFGGNADLKNIVITGARDDSLDWDMGWSGRVQFMVIQQYDDAGDNGFEADNWKDDHQAEPRSNPTMYNVTMIGASNPQKPQRAMNLRRGTAGSFHNFIIMGHTGEFLDIRDEVTADLALSGEIQFSHSFIYDVGRDGEIFSDEKDDDNGLIEEEFIRSQKAILFDVNPLLLPPQNQVRPNAIPRANSPVKNGPVAFPRGSFWDNTVDYAGAIEPSSTNDSWLSGWTDYPEK